MHAMVLRAPGAPLLFEQRQALASGSVRVRIGACGACRTDLHVVDGERPDISYPIVPGHEGASEQLPPVPLDAAIIYAPVGALVPLASQAVRKGGRVVCAGIHMSDIPSFPYRLLWEERQLLSVANLTRHDGIEFFKVAAQAGIRTHTTAFPLREANEGLSRLRAAQITGAAVLQP